MRKRMKKAIAITLSCAVLLTMQGLGAPQASAAKVKLNKTKLTLKVGKKFTLKLKGTKAKVKWSSSKKKVATVNKKGKVTAKKKGTTVITAKAKGKKYTCKVTVKKSSTTNKSPAPQISSSASAAPSGQPQTVPTSVPTSAASAGTAQGGTPPLQTAPAASASIIPVVSASTAPTASPSTAPTDMTSAAPTDTPSMAPTDMPSAAPTDTLSTAPADTPSAAPTDTPSAASTAFPYDPGDISKNVTVTAIPLKNSIQLEVTNHNPDWLNSVEILYDVASTSGAIIQSEVLSLGFMAPGETQYTAFTVEEDIRDGIAIGQSRYEIEAEEADPNGRYTDQKDSVSVSLDPNDIDLSTGEFIFTFKNAAETEINGSYIIYFRDSSGEVTDAAANTYTIPGSDEWEEAIPLPCTTDEEGEYVYSFTDDDKLTEENYEIIYTAHSFTEIDEEEMLAEFNSHITATDQKKLTDTILQVTVTNDNPEWLGAVALDEAESAFYDSKGNEVLTDHTPGRLLSMKPGESQSILIKFPEDILKDIDLDRSHYVFSAELKNESYTYEDSDPISYTLSDSEYNIDITNNNSYPVEGSFIIYFKDDSGKVVDAWQETYEIPENDTDSFTYPDLPYEPEEDEEEESPVKITYSVHEIITHIVQDTE